MTTRQAFDTERKIDNDLIGSQEEMYNPFVRLLKKDIKNPFEKLSQTRLHNPFESLKRPVSDNPFTHLDIIKDKNPFSILKNPSSNPFELMAIKKMQSQLEKIDTTIVPVIDEGKSQDKPVVLTSEQKILVQQLATIPIEQIAVVTSLMEATPEEKETIALEAVAIQQGVNVTSSLRQSLFLTWLNNRQKIYYLAVKVTLVIMVAVVISVALETASFWAILSQIWTLFGWQGLSLMGSMGLSMAEITATNVGVPTALNYLVSKNKRLWRIAQYNILSPEKQRLLKRLGISSTILNSTYEDLVNSATINGISMIRSGGPVGFIAQKGFGMAVSVGVDAVGKVTELGSNAFQSIKTLPSSIDISQSIRRFQSVISTASQQTQATLTKLQTDSTYIERADINLLATEIVNDNIQELNNLDPLLPLEEKQAIEDIPSQEIKQQVISTKAAGAIAALATATVTALIAGQFDQTAYVDAIKEAIIGSSIGARVVASRTASVVSENAVNIANYIGTQLNDSPLVRKLVFSTILSKIGLPRLLVRFGKFLTIDQIAKLKLLDGQIMTSSDREKNGLIKSFFDILIGRFYTSTEINALGKDELITILQKNNVQIKQGVRLDSLRRTLRQIQRDKQSISYQMTVDAMIDQVGSVATTLYLEKHVETMWSNRETLIGIINNSKLPLFDQSSEYYISPDERTAFNIMIKSKDFIARHVAQGATAMYQDVSEGAELMASIALQKANSYLATLSAAGGVTVISKSQPVIDKVDQAFNNIAQVIEPDIVVSDEQDISQVDKAQHAILIVTKEQQRLEDANDQVKVAEELSKQAIVDADIQHAKRAAIDRALKRYEQRTGMQPIRIGDVITSGTSLGADIIELLPSSIEYDKQRWLAELQADLQKNPSEFHKEQTRIDARAKATIHKREQAVINAITQAKQIKEQALNNVRLAMEQLENIQNRRQAISRAQERIIERNLRQVISSSKTIVATDIGLVSVNDDNLINDEKIMDALNYEFTPLIRKTARIAADSGVSWIPGIGWVNGAINKANLGLDVLETSRDLTNIMLRINTAVPIEQTSGGIFDSIRGALPEQLPKLFNWIPSNRLPSLTDALNNIIDVPKVNLRNIIFDASVKSLAYGWGKQELSLEIAKQIAGSSDVETIAKIMDQVSVFVGKLV